MECQPVLGRAATSFCPFGARGPLSPCVVAPTPTRHGKRLRVHDGAWRILWRMRFAAYSVQQTAIGPCGRAEDYLLECAGLVRSPMSSLAQRLRMVYLVTLLVLAGGANQASFGQASSQEEPGPVKIVYKGEPLVVELQCDGDHFQRAATVCSDATPCELYLELTDVGQASERVFLIGNLHTASATVSSILLASDDEGMSWYEPYPRLPAGLETIQFADDEYGWVSGQEGQLDSSSRPFLLRTSNGGVRWRRHYIWTDEDRSGAILDFYFDTEQHGLLSIDLLTSGADSYELYESMNGGLSWGIREISERPAKLKNIPLERRQPDWRLGEDAKKRSIQ